MNMKKDINMNAEAMIGTECFIDSESVIHYVKDLTCKYEIIQRLCWKEIQLLEADCHGEYYAFDEYILHDSLEDLEKLI